MMTVFYSVKGGSGVTVTAAVAADTMSRRRSTILVDLCGDQPAVLGLAEPSSEGVRDWLVNDGTQDKPNWGRDELEKLLIPVKKGLRLLPMGKAPWFGYYETRVAELATILADMGDDHEIVVDAGTAGVENDKQIVEALASEGRSFLVIRPCYLALRKAVLAQTKATGLIVLAETGRALSSDDVGHALNIPVIATIPVDPAIARSVDAGLLVHRSHHKVLEESFSY